MATWREFESGAPEMAAAAAMLWPGITTWTTARAAGRAVVPDRLPGHDGA